MTKIVKFPDMNAAINPDVVLEEAKGTFESLVLVGWDKEGRLDARATLNLSAAEVNWLISVFQQKLLQGDYTDD